MLPEYDLFLLKSDLNRIYFCNAIRCGTKDAAVFN